MLGGRPASGRTRTTSRQCCRDDLPDREGRPEYRFGRSQPARPTTRRSWSARRARARQHRRRASRSPSVRRRHCVCTISGTTVTIADVSAPAPARSRPIRLGNGNYNPAPQVTKNITITKADQNIVFGAAPSGVTFGDAPVTMSATTQQPDGAAVAGSGDRVRVDDTGGLHGRRCVDDYTDSHRSGHDRGRGNLHDHRRPGRQRELQRSAAGHAELRHREGADAVHGRSVVVHLVRARRP